MIYQFILLPTEESLCLGFVSNLRVEKLNLVVLIIIPVSTEVEYLTICLLGICVS